MVHTWVTCNQDHSLRAILDAAKRQMADLRPSHSTAHHSVPCPVQSQLQQRNQQLEAHIAAQSALPASPNSVQPPPIPSPTPPPLLGPSDSHPSPQSASSERSTQLRTCKGSSAVRARLLH